MKAMSFFKVDFMFINMVRYKAAHVLTIFWYL